MPVTVIVYYLSNCWNRTFGKVVLLLASVIFYAYGDYKTLKVLGVSIITNYLFVLLIKKGYGCRRLLVMAPIIINIGLLFYFKYLNFAISNVNAFFGSSFALRDLVLPVGISFFTFQQIAYVVSTFEGEILDSDLLDYLVYILYFPKILMGPLMEPADFLLQLNNPNNKKVDWDRFASGIFIFSLGLFKKVRIADVLARGVSWGFENVASATAIDWIFIMLSYTFEIYFDFSGYSDMAVGASYMLNITLPINFNSPYKATSIRDFWKRWHISLTKFFTKYVYIPLGGNRNGIGHTCLNTMIVFLISGLWHGANWTFILWGGVHGLLSLFDRIFDKWLRTAWRPIRWMSTFVAVNFLWLMFCSDSISQWLGIVSRIITIQDASISDELVECFYMVETPLIETTLHLGWLSTNIHGFRMIAFIIVAFAICLIPENNYKQCKTHSSWGLTIAAFAFVWSIIHLGGESVFVYYGF